MSEASHVKPAPLKNVALFSGLIDRVVERRAGVPGIGCFYGPTGLGKTKSTIYGANRYRALYVECGVLTTARSFLGSLLRELGVPKPGGTATDMIEQAVDLLAQDRKRPLIIDEGHHIAHKAWADVIRELHDKSLAPILLIGEETLPKRIEVHIERLHGRILDYVAAIPCDGDDFRLLCRAVAPTLKIAPDLAEAILAETRGNTRRIVVNLAAAEEIAASQSLEIVDLSAFGGREAVRGLKAPSTRVSA